MTAKLSDRFEFERVLWRQNVARVAGVDEAGRGQFKSGFAFLPPENYGQRHERR
jgi:hypothetical protein